MYYSNCLYLKNPDVFGVRYFRHVYALKNDPFAFTLNFKNNKKCIKDVKLFWLHCHGDAVYSHMPLSVLRTVC